MPETVFGSGRIVRITVATVTLLALLSVGVSPVAANHCEDKDGDGEIEDGVFVEEDECEDPQAYQDIGDAISSFLGEWGNAFTAVTEGWADGEGAGACTNSCPREA